MPFYNGEKWACYSCTKGHRSSKCAHYDRILYKVRKPGRPLNNCPHVLPESIQPGTFVNTSSDSMANGHPPKEACNCKNELVEVAIPKVKDCSCLSSSTSGGATPAPSSGTSSDNQSGVMSGRVNKRPSKGRKGKSNGETSPTPNGAPTIIAERVFTRNHPNTEGSKSHNSMSVSGVAMDIQTVQHGDSSTHADPSPWPEPIQNLPVTNLSASQMPAPFPVNAGDGRSSVCPSTPGLQSPFQENAGPTYQPAPGFASRTPFMSVPINNVHTLKQEPLMAPFVPNQHPAQFRDVTQANMSMGSDMVMVPLTRHEFHWIETARQAGVNFATLPHFAPKTDFQPTANTDSSESLSPLQPPKEQQKSSGCCSGKSAMATQAPVPGSTSAFTTVQQSSDTTNKPRCQCGDACRCVPCADHPTNPAMLEAVSQFVSISAQHEDNLLKRTPGGTPSYSGVDYDENSPAAEVMGADMIGFEDFVVYSYNYGASCAQGSGNCMCGEGCTCLGCLTHGGHNGVPLDLTGVTHQEQ